MAVRRIDLIRFAVWRHGALGRHRPRSRRVVRGAAKVGRAVGEGLLTDRQAGELRREGVAFRLSAKEFRVELDDRSTVLLELLEDQVVLLLPASVDLAQLVHLVEKSFSLFLRLEQRLLEGTESIERLLQLCGRRLVLKIVFGGLATSDSFRKRRLESGVLGREIVMLRAQVGELLEEVRAVNARRS